MKWPRTSGACGVPVVMGGIHATMCLDEALERVDAVVTGEAEGVWAQVLKDARHGDLQRRYDGGLAELGEVPPARHDLLPKGYAFGAIQTTRGCPLNCSFCSVTAFNGAQLPPAPHRRRGREFRHDPREARAGGGRQSHRHRDPSTSPAPRTCSAP